VGAAHDHVEGTEQLAQAGVDGAHLLVGDQPSAHPTLVRHHGQPHPGPAGPVERRADARQRCDLVRISVVRDVGDQRAVTVAEKGFWTC
jgi:hypothetical protein